MRTSVNRGQQELMRNQPKRLGWRSSAGVAIVLSLLTVVSISMSRAEAAIVIDDAKKMQLLVATLDGVSDASVLNALMSGMLKGLEGRRDVPAPANWTTVAARLRLHNNKRVRELSSQLSQIFGDEQAVQQALATVTDTQADPQTRQQVLQDLLAQQNVEASKLLEGLLDDPHLQLAAIRGYATVENLAAPSILLKRYSVMSPELRRAVVETLATRRPYAEALLTAVSKKQIRQSDVPIHVARSLNTLLHERYVSVFGELPTLGADREKQVAQWKSRITPEKLETADAANGRRVFRKTCAACHLLYGEGGRIGSDLTGSNRANLDYLLLNSVDPSYDVPSAYKMVTVVTVDGRAVNGVVAEEDTVRIILKTVENPRLVIAKADIDERVVSKKSMMPDGQLEALKPQEVIDLIKYLQTTQQVELAQ